MNIHLGVDEYLDCVFQIVAVIIVAERKKLNYIFDETVSLYFKGGIDCTAEVLTELLKLDAEAMKMK